MPLHVKEIETLGDAFGIAKVRNSGREFMTHDQDVITGTDQAKWFLQTYRLASMIGKTVAFVGREEDHHEAVAYGLVNKLKTDYWVTGVVAPEAQGHGYGRQLFEHLDDYVLNKLDADRVMLDVLNSNERAINLYTSLGYTAVTEGQYTTVMELTK